MFHKYEMVIDTINQLISKGHYMITCKKIKSFNGIDKSNRSINNYIWRNLEVLEKKGFLEQIRKKPVRKYLLPKIPIELEEVALK